MLGLLMVIVGALLIALQVVNANPIPSTGQAYAFNFMDSFLDATFLYLIPVVFAGDAIAQDFSHSSGILILSQPIKRSRILLARLASSVVASAGVIAVPYSISAILITYHYGASDIPFSMAWSYLAVVFFLAAALGLTFLFSSVFTDWRVAIIAALVVIAFVLPSVTGAVEFAGIEPWFLLPYAAGLTWNLLRASYPPHIQKIPIQLQGAGNSVSIGYQTVYTPDPPEALAIMAAYLIITVALSLLIYERKEVT